MPRCDLRGPVSEKADFREAATALLTVTFLLSGTNLERSSGDRKDAAAGGSFRSSQGITERERTA